MDWQPIETLPEGVHVLLYWPHGEKGRGGMETGTVYKEEGGYGYWTHGGPNAGSDWESPNGEKPTHWMPLPAAPQKGE